MAMIALADDEGYALSVGDIPRRLAHHIDHLVERSGAGESFGGVE
nr:hypothetical protein [Sphingomonas sp.]